MHIISLRQHPEYLSTAIAYFQEKWATAESRMVYEDCLTHCIDAFAPLPQWFLLYDESRLVGCAGLITNDFISRGELYPWLCALYIEEDCRGQNLGAFLIRHGEEATKAMGFACLYLCTDLEGYYEKFDFKFMGLGYHPWGESSRVYGKCVL